MHNPNENDFERRIETAKVLTELQSSVEGCRQLMEKITLRLYGNGATDGLFAEHGHLKDILNKHLARHEWVGQVITRMLIGVIISGIVVGAIWLIRATE